MEAIKVNLLVKGNILCKGGMEAAAENAVLMGADGRIPDKETPDIVKLEGRTFDLRDAIVIIGDMMATHLHVPAGSAVIATGIISCCCGD